jgi:hypothetical protein
VNFLLDSFACDIRFSDKLDVAISEEMFPCGFCCVVGLCKLEVGTRVTYDVG